MASTQVHDPATNNNGVRPDLQNRPVGELVQLLTKQVSELARDEVELAKAELTVKGKAAGVGGGMFGAAGVVVLLALGALTAAAILGLATVIDHAWIAALIVGAAYLAVAGILALMGKKSIQRATPLMPEQTTESVKEDVEWIKTRARSART
jgi:Putative Actinobacterial Holin-X, holin superfamily III